MGVASAKWFRPVKQRMRGNPGETLLLDLFSNCEWAWQTQRILQAGFFTNAQESVSQRFSQAF